MHCEASAPHDVSGLSSTLALLAEQCSRRIRQHMHRVFSHTFALAPSVSAVSVSTRRLEAPGGVVGSYLHASPAPGVGRMGALVGLQVLH
jgi:hypothetical protein